MMIIITCRYQIAPPPHPYQTARNCASCVGIVLSEKSTLPFPLKIYTLPVRDIILKVRLWKIRSQVSPNFCAVFTWGGREKNYWVLQDSATWKMAGIVVWKIVEQGRVILKVLKQRGGMVVGVFQKIWYVVAMSIHRTAHQILLQCLGLILVYILPAGV